MKQEPETQPYQTFEDLDVYKVAREFRKAMDGVARQLPDFEKFALADQIRRASVSRKLPGSAQNRDEIDWLDDADLARFNPSALEPCNE